MVIWRTDHAIGAGCQLRAENDYRNDPKFSDRQVLANSADLEEQSDQDLHCVQFHVHLLDALFYSKATLFKFQGDYSKCFRCPNF